MKTSSPPLPTDSAPVRRRFLGAALAVLLSLIGSVVLGLQPPGTSPAVAAATSHHDRILGRHGSGLMIRGQWFGSWQVPEGRGFCFEFDLDHPDSTGAHRLGTGRVPGMSREDSARVVFVAGRYARTRSSVDAAAAAIYVWQTQHTARFDRYYAAMLRASAIPTSVRHRLAEIRAEAEQHGPYGLHVRLGAGFVGQTVTGAVTATAAHGRAAAGWPVQVTSNGQGTIISRGRVTDRRGRLSVRVRINRPGVVQLAASLTTPTVHGVLITRPSPGRQRLVVAGPGTSTARAGATSERTPNRPQLTSTCGTDCRGVAPVTLTMTNPCGSATMRVSMLRNGRAIPGGSVDVAGCRTGRVTVRLPDESVVTTRSCYLAGGRCSSAAFANPARLIVICPPPVEVRSTSSCPCAGTKTITYEVRAPAGSSRRYRASLLVNDTPTEVALTNGRWQRLDAVPMPKGTTLELRVTVLARTTVIDRVQQQS